MSASGHHSAEAGLRLGTAPSEAAAVVVALHGRGQSPDYMVDNVIARLDDERRQRISFIVPQATDASWYPLGFLAALHDNQPALDSALSIMQSLQTELADVESQRVVWLGYSQGACLLAEHLARHPRRWGGAVVLTGGMIGPPDHQLTIDGGFDGMPVYFSNGDADEWVPLWRTQATADQFSSAGADVTLDVFPGRGHEIGDAEIERVQAMLDRVMS